MGRSSLPLAFALISLLPGLAQATSRGVDLVRTKAACELPARFIVAEPKQGKVVWRFERLNTAALSPACRSIASSFEVWIWSGSFSTLSNSVAYPLSITEPKSGEEFDLRLDFTNVREMPTKAQKRTTIVSGWFLAPEADAMKARTHE